jgi:hypothetical protein
MWCTSMHRAGCTAPPLHPPAQSTHNRLQQEVPLRPALNQHVPYVQQYSLATLPWAHRRSNGHSGNNAGLRSLRPTQPSCTQHTTTGALACCDELLACVRACGMLTSQAPGTHGSLALAAVCCASPAVGSSCRTCGRLCTEAGLPPTSALTPTQCSKSRKHHGAHTLSHPSDWTLLNDMLDTVLASQARAITRLPAVHVLPLL